MNELLTLLDDEIATLEALVSVAQEERQALMTFETRALSALVTEKERLLARVDEQRTAREALVCARAGGDAHLGRFIDTQPAPLAQPLAERRTRVTALIGALTELNQLALVHATRQLRWVRARRRSLGGGPNTYGRRGYEARSAPGLGLNVLV